MPVVTKVDDWCNEQTKKRVADMAKGFEEEKADSNIELKCEPTEHETIHIMYKPSDSHKAANFEIHHDTGTDDTLIVGDTTISYISAWKFQEAIDELNIPSVHFAGRVFDHPCKFMTETKTRGEESGELNVRFVCVMDTGKLPTALQKLQAILKGYHVK